ncbi:hypothetical protein BH20ACT24_BH20ACT24_02840 [soil metagenome]
MDSEMPERRVSRRDLLKKLGAGVAVAWSAPIVTSFGAKAFATGQHKNRCSQPCANTRLCCINCPGALDGLCGCSNDTELRCVCWTNAFCVDLSDCQSSADCGTRERCIRNTGCGFAGKCIPFCGDPVASRGARSGPKAIRIA